MARYICAETSNGVSKMRSEKYRTIFVPGAHTDTTTWSSIVKYEAFCLEMTNNIYIMINLEKMYIKDYTVTASDYTISIEKDSVYEFDIHYKS